MTAPTRSPIRTTSLDTAFTAARPRLFAIAYRMLGTRADAEDVLQDAWMRWHQAAPSALCWAELVSHTPAADPSDEEISVLEISRCQKR